MTRVLAAVVLLILLAAPASQDPLAFALRGQGDSGHHVVNPVDSLTWCGDCVGTDWTTGSPWVVNPRDSWPFGLPAQSFEPGCLWDSDDSYSYTATGNIIDAGVSAVVTECTYQPSVPAPLTFLTNVAIRSSSPDLIVTQTWTWDGGSVTHTFTPVSDAREWRYADCLAPPVSTGTPVEVPGSHGGFGIPTLVTVTVSNPTSRKIGKTGGVIEAGLINGISRGCATWIDP